MAAASVKEVAALAGVSLGTVSNVLNRPQKVSPSTVAKVEAAIHQLGFVRNDAARQLRDGHSNAIGLLILDVANPFFTDIARGAQVQAASAGYSVLLGYSDEKSELEGRYLDLFEEQRVHGVLLSPIGNVDERLYRLRQREIPVVLVDRVSTDPSFSSVSMDDVAGGILAVEHLVSRHRRHIGFVGGPLSIRQVEERFLGANQVAAVKEGVSLELVPTAGLSIAEGRRVGADLAGRTTGTRPDAIFAANDLLALGVLQAVLRSGLRVPEDIAIVGYDDIGFAEAAVVPLTSIHQPSNEFGRTAMDLLLQEAKHPEQKATRIVFKPTLIERDSSG